jgi:AcrR family transcriptional regulator
MWYRQYVSMHTAGMSVNPQNRGQARSSSAASRTGDSTATRTALLKAARQLFGEQGYAATSVEEVVAAAGVTKGALYHHFGDKADLFRAVYEQVKREVTEAVVEVYNWPDPWESLTVGCRNWIDAHLDPAVRRIVLQDARAVLGWETLRDLENRYGAVALRGALRKSMTAGGLEATPLRPLALMLIGALAEACLYVADADDPVAARAEVDGIINRILTSFRPGATADSAAG